MKRPHPLCPGPCHDALIFVIVGLGVLTAAGVALLFRGACFPR